MKKNYLHFVIVRALIGVLVGIIIFFSSVAYLKDVYYKAIELGIYRYEDTLRGYISDYSDSDKSLEEKLFMKELAFDSAFDYLRIARIKEDGSYDTLCETDYDTIPVFVVGMGNYVVITKDTNLPDKPDRHIGTEDNTIVIDYRKCDEIWSIERDDPIISDTGAMIWFSGVANVGNYAFDKLTRAISSHAYTNICCDSYYMDDEYLYLGKVFECDSEYRRMPDGKTWDFTNKNDSSRYTINDGDDSKFQFVSGYKSLEIYQRPIRPDKFFEQEGDLFLTTSSNDFYAYEKFDERFSDFNSFNTYTSTVELENGRKTTGTMKLLNYGSEHYLLQYVVTTAPFEEFFGTFLIVYPIVLLLLCIGIPCLLAIAPYKRYKKDLKQTVSIATPDKTEAIDIVDTGIPDVKAPLRDIGKYVKELKDAEDEETKAECYSKVLGKITELDIGIDEIINKPHKK